MFLKGRKDLYVCLLDLKNPKVMLKGNLRSALAYAEIGTVRKLEIVKQ